MEPAAGDGSMIRMTVIRLDREAEVGLARTILAIEGRVGAALVERAIVVTTTSAGRTRGGRVAAVERAVRASGDAALAAEWATSQHLRWRLALSASAVVYQEARRRA